MSSLNDLILLATGGPTLNEGLATWYSKTADESLNDAERRWLFEGGADLANINDMWRQYFACDGALADCRYRYWETVALKTAIQIENAQTTVTGAHVLLEFNGTIVGTPIAADFTLSPIRVISSVKLVGAAVLQLTLGSSYTNVDVITCSFTDTQSTNIDDFVSQSVTNLVT